jgi:hypothetical protein
MSDYYLRATDEAAMNAALNAAAVIDSEGNPFPGMEVSIIGGIVKDGQALPGWHANLRTTVELLDSQIDELPVIDPPKHPVRVWFDDVPTMGVIETTPIVEDAAQFGS